MGKRLCSTSDRGEWVIVSLFSFFLESKSEIFFMLIQFKKKVLKVNKIPLSPDDFRGKGGG